MAHEAMASGVAEWLLTYLLHSTVLLAGAAAATYRLRSAARAELLWKAALLGGVLSATLQVGAGWMPAAPLELSYLAPAGEGGSAGLEATARGAAASLPPEGPGSRRASWALVLTVLWGTGAAAGLLRLAARHAGLAWRLRGRTPLTSGAASDALALLRRGAGVRRPVRLSVSGAVATPVALRGGEICLPPRALTLAPDRRNAMLAHELAHVLRRDPAWLLALAVLERLLWMQPLNRVAARAVRRATEVRCDQWAVRQTGCGEALARCLVEVAEWVGARQVAAPVAAMAAAGAGLYNRVELLLAPPAFPAGERRGTVRLVLMAALLTAVGALAPNVSIPEPERPPIRVAPVAHLPAIQPRTPDAFCWGVDGQPANGDCTVVIASPGAPRLTLPASAVRPLARQGHYRVTEPAGGARTMRLEVRAMDFRDQSVHVLLADARPGLDIGGTAWPAWNE